MLVAVGSLVFLTADAGDSSPPADSTASQATTPRTTPGDETTPPNSTASQTTSAPTTAQPGPGTGTPPSVSESPTPPDVESMPTPTDQSLIGQITALIGALTGLILAVTGMIRILRTRTPPE
jgi:hypothetical protein